MKLPLVIVIAGLLMVSCQDDKKLNELEKKLAISEASILRMQEQINALKASNESLERSININEFIYNMDKLAYLTPGQTGYSTIRFDLGVLTVSLEDIKPYANGSKITLNFGNTLSSSINGLKGTFEWGKVDEKGSPIDNLAKTKDITFSETLIGGSWTRVSVVLDGIPPTEFGFLRLKNFSHSGIKLAK
ncbi:MAG: DUF3251 domain-containing protein [Gammaproteobacteria bacterium]|nr:MAG: DUF3251 domain-containing protein [Gammaproteobacteria bacterium]